ncbi:MAG: NifU family protein [Anaerolineaceae bacterium]|nr:NifU family protein [Anaerolineaceae bacterium]
MNDHDVYERVTKAEMLLKEIEALRDPKARNTAVSAVQSLLELYGEALARILNMSHGVGGEALLQTFADDELVGHLLLLHDLHPTDLQTRVEQALVAVRPYLQSHGGSVALLGIENGTVHLKLLGSGCGQSTPALKAAVEQAIYEAAPDVLAIETVDTAAANGFISVESLLEGVKLGG